MNQGPKDNAPPIRWSLEVIRGLHVGRVINVIVGEVMIGSITGSPTGINLAEQEGTSPRKMEKRHAALTCSKQSLSIRDLESPGGTFVNHKRLLSRQTCPLASGDVIQLGAVQLTVIALTPTKPEPRPAAAAPKPSENRSVRTPAQPATHPPAAPPKPTTTDQKPKFATNPPPPPPSPPLTSTTEPPPKRSNPAPLGGQASATKTEPQHHSSRLPLPFQIKDGAACRAWDDFLVQAAQRWQALRDELASGRLADYLRSIDRPDLLPRPVTGRSLDDQLDDWLARLPTTQSSEPELDAHPASLEVRQASAGGTVNRSIRVTNIGYRLLRGTARVEPPGTAWLRLGPDPRGYPFSAIEEIDLAVELDLPEIWAKPLTAAIIIESNGGTRRIPVKLEQAEKPPEPDFGFERDPAPTTSGKLLLLDFLQFFPPAYRMMLGAISAAVLRAFPMFGHFGLPSNLFGSPNLEPRLLPIAIEFCVIAQVIAGVVAIRYQRAGDLKNTSFAGAILGLMSAALMFALIRTIEPLFGSVSSSIIGKIAIWAGLGAVTGLISTVIVPFTPRNREAIP